MSSPRSSQKSPGKSELDELNQLDNADKVTGQEPVVSLDAVLKTMREQNLYERLGIKKSDPMTDEVSEIDKVNAKKAFRKLNLRYHPDKNQNEAETANIIINLLQNALGEITNPVQDQSSNTDSEREDSESRFSESTFWDTVDDLTDDEVLQELTDNLNDPDANIRHTSIGLIEELLETASDELSSVLLGETVIRLVNLEENNLAKKILQTIPGVSIENVVIPIHRAMRQAIPDKELITLLLRQPHSDSALDIAIAYRDRNVVRRFLEYACDSIPQEKLPQVLFLALHAQDDLINIFMKQTVGREIDFSGMNVTIPLFNLFVAKNNITFVEKLFSTNFSDFDPLHYNQLLYFAINKLFSPNEQVRQQAHTLLSTILEKNMQKDDSPYLIKMILHLNKSNHYDLRIAFEQCKRQLIEKEFFWLLKFAITTKDYGFAEKIMLDPTCRLSKAHIGEISLLMAKDRQPGLAVKFMAQHPDFSDENIRKQLKALNVKYVEPTVKLKPQSVEAPSAARTGMPRIAWGEQKGVEEKAPNRSGLHTKTNRIHPESVLLPLIRSNRR